MLQEIKKLFATPSVEAQVAIGKTAGVFVGLIYFILMPIYWAGSTPMFEWGLLLWYTSIGAFIGMFATMKRVPILNINLSWWFRGIWLGGWMNFILSLFLFDFFTVMLEGLADGFFAGSSPFWFVLEGVVFGLFISFCVERFSPKAD